MTRTVYRADHVGSFLRPAELLAARADHHTSAGKLREVHLGLRERERFLGLHGHFLSQTKAPDLRCGRVASISTVGPSR